MAVLWLGGGRLAAAEPPAPEVVVGATSDNYPFSFADSSGKLDGFVVDLLDAVARSANLRIRRVVMPGRTLQTHFANGEYDCLQVYSETEERETFAEFSVPYFTLQGCIFVRQDGPIRSYEDFEGKHFAVVGRRGTAEAFLRDHHISAVLIDASSPEEALRQVQAGACAGTFLSRLTALSVIEHTGLTGVAMLGQPLSDYDVRQCFAVHRGDTRLLARLNEGLAIVNRNGQYEAIYRKWFGRIDSPFVTREQVVTAGVIVLAIGFVAALWAYLRQRVLRKRIAGQAAELDTQRALLRALYDNIPLGLSVIELGPDGPRLVSINREAGRLYGVDPDRSVEKLLSELALSPGAKAHLDEVLRRRPESGQILHYDFPLERERRVLEVTVVPLAPGNGASAHLCVLAEDVSARKLMDAEIAQSRRLRAVGELVGGIAHEFNNLLTPVMLKVGEIQLDWNGDARLQQEMGVIAHAAKRAAELTRRLLTFGRKSENRAEPVRLAGVVANCFDLLRHTVDRRIVWESDVPESLPPILFNATDLNQVLLNLLLNARDTLLEKLATAPDSGWAPRIRVTAAALPPEGAEVSKARAGRPLLGWQRLTVQDNGVGIPGHVVERIFEPFFTTKDVGKGTGLGLATVWHIVTEAGGRVEVDSTPGVGSTFHVFLPEWRAAEEPGSAKAGAGVRAPPVRAVRVFLVEDEDLVAEAVTAMLQRGGHEVRRVADGAEAWRHLSEDLTRYELLVIDVNLPGMNGVDLVGRLRERRYGGRIFVVSGRLGMGELRALVQLHVDRVLTKPFSLEQFETAVRECLSAEG